MFCLIISGLALSSPGSDAAGRAASVHGAPGSTPIIISDLRGVDVRLQSAYSQVHASDAALLATGSGVKVAILDGGFDLGHEYLSGHLGSQWDALDQDSSAQDLGNDVDDDSDGATDWCVGHGTFVAGLVIACADDAVILPIRVLDDEGNGSAAALARGIDKAVELGAHVINMSFVAGTMTQQLTDSIDDAVDAGVVIVCAAGNDPAGPYPGVYLRERSIVVGAVDEDSYVADFSPNSSLVDVFAPGVDIVGPLGGHDVDTYATWSGTSFSTALVTAAAACVREEFPSQTRSWIKARIASSVDTVHDADPSDRGSVDFLDALTD